MATVRISRYQAERGLLPAVCAYSGQPTDDVKEKKFTWIPPWVRTFSYFFWPAYLVLSMTHRKEMTVELPLMRKHHGHWLVRTLILVGGLLLAIVLVVGGVIAADELRGNGNAAVGGITAAAGGVVFLATLITAIVLQFTTIRPDEITDEGITLAGVHEDFARAVRESDEYEDDRPRRRRRRDDYDDRGDGTRPVAGERREYDDRDPPRQAARDDYEDDRPRRPRRDDDDDYRR